MRISGFRHLLAGLLLSSAAIAQSDTPVPGTYTDGQGLEFFETLRVAHFDYAPRSFEEIVQRSTVIAKGNLMAVMPGRVLGSTLTPGSSSLNTLFLKIVPSNVLKGIREEYFLVEVPATHRLVDALTDQLYSGDLVFLLSPAGNMFVSPEIRVAPEAEFEWLNGKSLYMLTMHAALFTLTGSGNLASPIEATRTFSDLYANMRSLEALESHISSILADQPVPDGQTEGGSRQWHASNSAEPREGLIQQWHEGGELQSEVNYRNDEMNGLTRWWYASGQPWSEINFDNGQPDGPALYWHENGQLAMQASYRGGERIRCEAWAQDGSEIDCP